MIQLLSTLVGCHDFFFDMGLTVVNKQTINSDQQMDMYETHGKHTVIKHIFDFADKKNCWKL